MSANTRSTGDGPGNPLTAGSGPPAGGHRPPPHRRGTPRGSIKPAAVRMIERHGEALLATARRYTVSREDAEDAYQRGLEILLARAPRLPEDELVRWTKTVIKHEAFAIWRGRERTGPAQVQEALEQATSPVAPPDDHVESYERLRQGAEALARLKPQEVRCLLLRAEGYSYRQICELTGWTYTKVNRCLTEGRRSFLERVAGIESGAECARLAPLLSALADGEATATDLATLRPHLRSCLACRATLRAFREIPHRAAEVVPVAATATGSEEAPTRVLGWAESAVDWAQERAGLIAAKVQAVVDGTSAGKAAAVAASTAALAGGAAAVGTLDGQRDRAPLASLEQAEPLLEGAAAVAPRPAPVAALEPEIAPPTPPAPVVPPAAPPAPELAPPPAPIPPGYTPPAERSEQFPARLTTPVTDSGDSALASADEEERRIEPMTRPAEPPPGRPPPERAESGSQEVEP